MWAWLCAKVGGIAQVHVPINYRAPYYPMAIECHELEQGYQRPWLANADRLHKHVKCPYGAKQTVRMQRLHRGAMQQHGIGKYGTLQ